MNVKLILLFSYFLFFSACNYQKENEATIVVPEASLSLVSLRILDIIFTSTDNRASQFHDHIFFKGNKDLIFKNSQDTTKIFSFLSILNPLLKVNLPLTLSQKIVSFFKILPIS